MGLFGVNRSPWTNHSCVAHRSGLLRIRHFTPKEASCARQLEWYTLRVLEVYMAAAPAPVHVSLYEYLHSDYQPDVDFVDGVLEERNLGEFDHADLQGELVTLFRTHRNDWHVSAYPELRVQVGPTRYRVPDVCVLRADQPRTAIVQQAPLLCIEILSPEDRFARIRTRCDDYLKMGVAEAWIFDPADRVAMVLHHDGTMTTHREGVLGLEGTSIEIPLAELFRVLDA